MDLKQIFESITPENIKDIPLIRDAMDIFIDNLKQNSEISVDIKKLYDPKFEEIRKNILKTYLSSLYNTILDVQGDQVVQNKIEMNETPGDVIPLKYNVNDILNDEYLETSKNIKQKIGTNIGVEYSYNFAKYLQDGTKVENDFDMIEIQPFYFQTEGSIYKEIYENVVKPLSHPIGFTYVYSQIIKNSISDFFGLLTTYNGNSVEVRCLDGYFDVYTKDANDTNVKADFLTRTNFLTGQLFTEQEYYQYVTVIPNRIVKDISAESLEDSYRTRVTFEDSGDGYGETIIEQYTNPIQVYYRRMIDEVEENNNYLKYYTNHCSLYYDYEIQYNTTYTDNIDQFIVEMEITKIKENNGGDTGTQYYSITDGAYSFNIGGDLYTYVPGQDEGATTIGETSTDSYINVTIGELKSGLFAPADELLDGLYTQGNDYTLDYTSDSLLEEETFIYVGRKLNEVGTSDVLVMTSTDYCTDDFLIYQENDFGYFLRSGSENISVQVDPITVPYTYTTTSSSGNIIYWWTDPENGDDIQLNGDFYFYTSDNWYLRANPNT